MAKSKCPKCGYELKITDIKAECPKCGTNLMYYQMEQRLEQDAIQAEKEWAAVARITSGIKASSVGGPLQIVRLVAYVLSIAALLLPMVTIDGVGTGLIQFISSMTAEGADMMAVLFGSQNAVMTTVLFFGTAVFALLSLILSLFSFTKRGLVRNIVFTVLQLICVIVPGGLLLAGGASFAAGFFVEAVLIIVLIILNILIHNKLKVKTEI